MHETVACLAMEEQCPAPPTKSDHEEYRADIISQKDVLALIRRGSKATLTRKHMVQSLFRGNLPTVGENPSIDTEQLVHANPVFNI